MYIDKKCTIWHRTHISEEDEEKVLKMFKEDKDYNEITEKIEYRGEYIWDSVEKTSEKSELFDSQGNFLGYLSEN